MTRRYIFLLAHFFIAYKLVGQPVINNINPVSGLTGSSVTINGSGFSTTPTNNIVYFGSSVATVTSASTSTLTVVVPTGFSAEPITVTTNNLTAYSPVPFIVTFAGGGAFTGSSFATKFDIASSFPNDVFAFDVDGDNKPELISSSLSTNTISVFKNTCTSNSIAFSTRLDFPAGAYSDKINFADIDGDGLKDIVVILSQSSNYYFSVFRNTTTGGIISFAPKVDFLITTNPYTFVIGEIDGDGKPDIVAPGSSSILVFRNTSVIGTISFTTAFPIASGGSPSGIAIADINANGRADIITCNEALNKVSIISNNSTPGNISFSLPISYTTGSNPIAVAVGNLDTDGNPDIVVCNYGAPSISIFKNASVGSSISFDPKQDIMANVEIWDIKIADINGDGKQDIISGSVNNIVKKISLFRNTTIGSIISFENKIDYVTDVNTKRLALADLTNSGRLDIVTTQNSANKLSIFRNKIGDPSSISSFSPTSAGAGAVVSIRGTNLANVTAISFGAIPVISFDIISDTSINVKVGVGASGNVSITSPAGSAILGGFTYLATPNITSFSPQSGPVGQRVKISGNNFSNNPTDNIVYFGAVKALVNSASLTTLFVTVPSGASYQAISVTVNSLTAWSKQPFNITFPSGIISSSTFIKRISLFDNNLDGAENVALADIDGDGRTDVIAASYTTNGILVYRNTTLNGIVSFSTGVGFSANGSHTRNLSIADFNGDGKLDIIVPNEWSGPVAVFKNTSVPGAISFAPASSFPVGYYPDHIAVGDLDGDGKADLAVATNSIGAITVLKNTSTLTNISFAPAQYYSTRSYNTLCTHIGDIDGDGKPDVVATNIDSTFSVFKNTSIIGTLNFANRADYVSGKATTFVTMADIDGDNKQDLVFATGTYSGIGLFDTTIIIIPNHSTPGNFSFAPRINLKAPAIWNIAFTDADGDGKPDMIYNYYDTLLINKNTSVFGNISFAPKTNFFISLAHQDGVASGDLDGDGKPDIAILANTGSNSMAILINQNPSDLSICPGGNGTIVSNIIGSLYQWQVDPGTGYINIINNSNYLGALTQTLQLNAIPSSWYGFKFRCRINGSTTGKVSVLRFVNQWTGAANSLWENPANWSCGTVPDNNTDVIISSGPVTVSSNVLIRSLRIDPDVNLTVNNGYTFIITN